MPRCSSQIPPSDETVTAADANDTEWHYVNISALACKRKLFLWPLSNNSKEDLASILQKQFSPYGHRPEEARGPLWSTHIPDLKLLTNFGQISEQVKLRKKILHLGQENSSFRAHYRNSWWILLGYLLIMPIWIIFNNKKLTQNLKSHFQVPCENFPGLKKIGKVLNWGGLQNENSWNLALAGRPGVDCQSGKLCTWAFKPFFAEAEWALI